MENNKPTPILPAPGEEEVWKTHPIYTEYQVSTFGNVRRIRTQRLLTRSPNSRGYETVHLRAGIDNPNGKYPRVHILVAETFLGPCPEGMEIDHADRNRLNNYYKNLSYMTHKDNVGNAKKDRRPRIMKDKPALVLLDKDTHELIREFANVSEATEAMNVASRSIRDNIHGHKATFRFGYFMIKDEWLQKKDEKI